MCVTSQFFNWNIHKNLHVAVFKYNWKFETFKQGTFLCKNHANVHQKLVPDPFLILVNNPKQPLHARNSFKNKVFWKDEKITKFEYFEKQKSFLDKIKQFFHILQKLKSQLISEIHIFFRWRFRHLSPVHFQALMMTKLRYQCHNKQITTWDTGNVQSISYVKHSNY